MNKKDPYANAREGNRAKDNLKPKSSFASFLINLANQPRRKTATAINCISSTQRKLR